MEAFSSPQKQGMCYFPPWDSTWFMQCLFAKTDNSGFDENLGLGLETGRKSRLGLKISIRKFFEFWHFFGNFLANFGLLLSGILEVISILKKMEIRN